MPVELTERASSTSRPIHLVAQDELSTIQLPERHHAWMRASGFAADSGRLLLLPGSEGNVEAALFGTGTGKEGALQAGSLARLLPEGDWHFADAPAKPALAALAVALGGSAFTRYGIRLAVPDGAERAQVERIAEGIRLCRDLINTPTNDLGPDALENAIRVLAGTHHASVTTVAGDALLTAGFPMIHAVGRAAAEAPRLVDMIWGRPDAPRVTLVGKGVCFDTGGLDIKPSSSMLLMKKDMGGAANVLGLASMIMAAKIDIRLRVLVPIVENSIAGNAFRPGDVLPSRKGLTVEIGNTDAEGRLILADALALADEEGPELLVDMATLTGAARVALGPDLPPFYTDDDALAAELSSASASVEDPMWRMPLWNPYGTKLASKIADLNNVTTDGFAGSITAALFLRRFVERSKAWAHFDIFAWNPVERPYGPVGGEAQAIRALDRLITGRYRR